MSKKIQKAETKQQTELQNRRQLKNKNQNSKHKWRTCFNINCAINENRTQKQIAINTKFIYHINYTYKLNKMAPNKNLFPQQKNSNNAKIMCKLNKKGKPMLGTIKELVTKYEVCRKTITRVWKEVQK